MVETVEISWELRLVLLGLSLIVVIMLLHITIEFVKDAFK